MAIVAAVIVAKIMDKYIIKILKEENDIVFEPDTRWGNIYGNINDQGDLTDLFSHYTTNDEFNNKIDEINNNIQEVVVNTEQKIISAVTDGKVSLDGYATEKWVEDKNYITGVDLSDYATIDYVDALGNNVVANSNDIKTLSAKCEDFITLEDVSVIKGEKGDDGWTISFSPLVIPTENGIVKKGSYYTIVSITDGNKNPITPKEYYVSNYEIKGLVEDTYDLFVLKSTIGLDVYLETIDTSVSDVVGEILITIKNRDTNKEINFGTPIIFISKGDSGYTPVKGVDYFTNSDIEQIADSAYTKVYNDDRIAKKTDLDALSGTVSTINSTYASTNFVSEAIAQAKLDGSDVDLSQYALREEIPNNISELNNDVGYITIDDIGDIKQGNTIYLIDGSPMSYHYMTYQVFLTSLKPNDITPKPNDLIISSSFNLYKISTVNNTYVTCSLIGSLKGSDGTTPVKGVDYFTNSDIEQIVNSASTIISNDDSIVKSTDLDNYATTEYVNTQIAQAQLGGSDVDLSGYLTKESGDTLYQPKGTYLTQHQSLANYALKSEIPTVPANIMTESNYETIDVVGTKEDGSTITYKFLVKK